MGEPLVCFAPELNRPGVYRRFLGGAEVNTAVGLARLGHRVQLLAAVGSDPHGDFVRAALAAEGVATDLVGRDPRRPTGVLIKERPTTGEPWVRYARVGSAASAMEPSCLPAAAIGAHDLVHLTGVFLSLGEGPKRLAQTIMRTAVAAGVPISFDVNHRPALIDAAAMREQVIATVPLVTHLLCNEREALLVTGYADIDRELAALRDMGPRVVIVKRGVQGASALIDGARFDVPAVPVSGPIDTVGAGDAFNAGWLHGWLTAQENDRALQLGAFAASLVVADGSDHGGFPSAEVANATFARMVEGAA